MFCYNCGNKLQDDSMFCDNCGVKVNGSENSSSNYNSEQNDTSTIDIDVEKIKSKIKSGANTIKGSSIFNRLLSFLTRPLTTTLSVVKSSEVTEIFILGFIFLGIILINSIISSFGMGSSIFDRYYGGVLTYFSWKLLGAMIIVSIISVVVSTFISALFLKIGNGEDFIRKGFAIAVMTTGLYSIIGLVSSIILKVTVIGGVVVSVIGLLLYLNLYYISFMEHIKVSRDVKFLLPIISIAVYLIIMVFILAEFIARTFLDTMYGMFNFF